MSFHLLLTLCMYYLEQYFYNHLLNFQLSCFSVVELQVLLIYSRYYSFIRYMICKYLPPFFLLTFLVVIFALQKFLLLSKFNSSTFYCIAYAVGDISKKLSSNPIPKVSPCFILKFYNFIFYLLVLETCLS